MKGLKVVFSDRHEWLVVALAEYWRAGIHEQVSKYSFADSRNVYLEMDVDAWLYLDFIGYVDPGNLPFTQLRGTHPDSISREVARFDVRRPVPPVAVARKGAA